MRFALLIGLVAGVIAAPAAAQSARPGTVEDFVKLYGGADAARSFAAAERLAPYESDVTLSEGCGNNCTVRALVIEARPRAQTGSRQLCFANPVPFAVRVGTDVGYGLLVHAEATVTTNAGPAVLGYRLFARMDTRTAGRAKPNLSGDWCVVLPVAISEAAAGNGWSVALRAIPPRDPRFAYANIADARLAPKVAAGVVPVRFDPDGAGYAEALIRSKKPGARISVSGVRSKLKTPATLSFTEAAAKRVEIRQGKATARLDSCNSQWSPDMAAFVFDCPI